MQIFPSSRTSSDTSSYAILGDALSQTPFSGRDSADFAQLIMQQMALTPAEVTPVVDTETDPFSSHSKEEDSSLSSEVAATAAPYTTGVSERASASQLRLNDKEVQAVADSLREQGVDPKVVREVEKLKGHPGGVSVEEIVKTVAQEKPAKLTEGDLHRISSLAKTLDPSGKLSESLLESIRQGDTQGAWNLLTQALQQADPSTLMRISQAELLALGKGLALSADTLQKLGKSFGGKDELAFTPEGLQALLTPAQKEMAERGQARNALVGQLEKALIPVVSEARKRIAAEEEASSRESRRTQQSRLLIEDSVTRNGLARQEATKGEEAAAALRTSRRDDDSRSNPSLDQVYGRRNQEASSDRAQALAGKNAESPLDAQSRTGTQTSSAQNASAQNGTVQNGTAQNGRQSSSQDADQSGRQALFGKNDRDAWGLTESGSKRSDNAWDGLLQRLNVQSSPTLTATQLAAQMATQSATQTARATQTLLSNVPTYNQSQILSQVEQGLLSALRDGTKRLEIQLHPAELGAMSVMLSSRNGEVSATLRAERGETAVLLSQQLDQLRQNLEQQGIKVDKVEVQTQLRDGQNTTWQGMNQHNQSQEQQARREEVERMRRLNRIGLDTVPDSLSALRAGNMPTAPAGEGLHLVA